jgi:hypothetical protein
MNLTHSKKISQLADDTTLYFNSKNDISVAMNEIEIFGNFSGLMINRNKTEGLWIGKLKIGIIKALMISTLPNIERFRFDHDKNKLFIFSIFFSQLSFSHSM